MGLANRWMIIFLSLGKDNLQLKCHTTSNERSLRTVSAIMDMIYVGFLISILQ